MFQTNTNNNGGNGNKSSSIKRHHNQHPYQNYNNRSSSSSSSFTQSHHRHQQQQQNGGGPERVIRSEVWNCFDLDGLNAICRACNERLKVGPTRQTSSLWRHLKRHTREVQSQLLRPSRSTPSAVKYLPNRDGHGQQQQQQFGEFMTSAESNTLRNLGPGPLVTVDCKPVESLDLEQLLLGIQQQSDDGQSPMEELLDGEIMINGKGTTMMDTDTILLEENDKEEEDNNHINGDGFQEAVIEFLLENALPFRRTIFQSPSLTRLLQSFSSANAIGDPQRRHPTMLLPSPDSLLGCFAPKMFNRDLEERKAQFEDDFFVLVLRRMRVDIGQPKGTWITRVSAVKLSQSFGLCSRSLGVFAFRGGINRMRDALQKCFEHGNIQLKLWQVSAVMHDGTADFVELCKQLDLPGIPSTRSLLRNIYVELDKLEFSAECLRRVKTRFEQAIGDTLDDSHFSAFSISVPFLINRIDHFFQENCTEERSSEQPSADVRLMQKFRTLWAFQRERLLAEPVARMSIFLNPNACHQSHGPFNVEQWAQIGANIVEEICQACLPAADEISEVEIQERKADIEAEVNNFIESAICEGRSRIGDQQGGMAREEVTVKKQSLSELLFWWRINLERFPRVGHLARQFCAIPLWETDSGDWRTGKKQGSNEHQLSNLHDIDTKNATYAAELMRKDLADQGEEEALQTLTQLLTIRMAILERNGCVLLE